MKKAVRWMSLMCVLSAALSAVVVASRAEADRAKEIALTPAAEVKYVPLDPADKQGKGPQISVVFGDMKKKAIEASNPANTSNQQSILAADFTQMLSQLNTFVTNSTYRCTRCGDIGTSGEYQMSPQPSRAPRLPPRSSTDSSRAADWHSRCAA